MTRKPHLSTTEEIVSSLGADLEYGLKSEEVRERLKIHGENRLKEHAGISPWVIIASQFRNIIVVLLLAATGISLLLQVRGDLELFLKTGALASNAAINKNEQGQWDVVGDPTEGAIVAAAMKGGFNPEEARRHGYHELKEIPFNSDEKRMAVYYRTPENQLLLVAKGSPEVILSSCSRLLANGQPVELDQKWLETVKRTNEQMGKKGLRVLALAYRPIQSAEEEAYRDLVFIGLAGIMDPPREEARQAIEEASRAGIRTIMITGDQPETARSI